jgi:hypothetical protein
MIYSTALKIYKWLFLSPLSLTVVDTSSLICVESKLYLLPFYSNGKLAFTEEVVSLRC